MPNKYTQASRKNKNVTVSPNLPVKTFRLGRIKAAVWENQAEQKFYSVTFARTYVDDENKYHGTDSFGRDDLPLVAKLADQAHTFIFERLAELKTNRTSNSRLSERPVIPAALFVFLREKSNCSLFAERGTRSPDGLEPAGGSRNLFSDPPSYFMGF